MRAIAVLLLVLSMQAFSQIPRTISFQGVLADAQGNFVSDGNHALVLTLYTSPTGGSALYTETQTVPVVKGLFNAIIGSVTPLPASLGFERAYYLAVRVDGGVDLTPRTALTAVPYAMHAAVADAVAAGASGVVSSVNGQGGDLTIVGSGSTTITNNGKTIVVASTGGSGGTGMQGVQNLDGSIGIQNPTGPVATLSVPDRGLSPLKLNPIGAGNGDALVYEGGTVQWKNINSGGGVTSVQSADGSMEVANPNGPAVMLAVKSGGIGNAQLTDNGITAAKIAPVQVVKSINALRDDVTIEGGSNVTVTQAGNAITVSASGGASSPWSLSGNDISNTNSGNVGIGTSTPAHRLSLFGGPTWTSNGWTGALALPNGAAIGWYANAGNQRFGIGQSGGGLFFFRTTSDPGTASSPAQYDMIVSDDGRVGIGTITPTDGQLSVAAVSSSTAIYGKSGSGIGVHGVSTSNYGIYAASSTGYGLLAESSGFVGIFGHSNGASSVGIFGSSPYIGAEGFASGADANRQAVRGDNAGAAVGYAGLFYGNTWVVGTLTKNAGAFRIDHPLDPANKTLTHSFVESPDMKNIYDGIVTTDANGEATVTMPDWFDALNRDFRYQLTAIGQFSQTIVLRELSGNQFSIKTDKPNVKISWQVTGIRHDAYANARRIPVEENKPTAFRGLYIFPEGFGFDQTRAIGAALSSHDGKTGGPMVK